ncbi:MAG TPA: hypothetical protein VG713_04565, partial [Pirellulales bacterium]|nr:hypothetical protein [Pirellulales bacterium]
MTDTALDTIETAFARDCNEGLATLAAQLRSERRFHDLFELRLVQARHAAGLPLVATSSLDDLCEPLRTQMEQAYLNACREIGAWLLEENMIREAWMYLRPVGDKATIRAALEQNISEDNFEMMIEMAVYEGIAPAWGFSQVLNHYGLCNAISMFDAELPKLSRYEKQEIASSLVRFIHRELLESLERDIQRQEGARPKEKTIAELVADRDWLFADDNYHIDTSHLNSVVRFALLVDDRDVLRLAVDLTEYGRRLNQQFQFAGETPFTEAYPSSALFFRALLGENVEQALAFFKNKATERPVSEIGSGPAEVYISLQSRLGHYDEAMRAVAELLPPEARGGHFAPSLYELAQMSHRYDCLREVARQRGDLLGLG